MNAGSFFKGVGAGMAAGAVVTLVCMPKKKSGKSVAGKALKSVGEVIDGITEALGH